MAGSGGLWFALFSTSKEAAQLFIRDQRDAAAIQLVSNNYDVSFAEVLHLLKSIFLLTYLYCMPLTASNWNWLDKDSPSFCTLQSFIVLTQFCNGFIKISHVDKCSARKKMDSAIYMNLKTAVKC